MSKRVNAIQEVNESVALLTQLLQEYDGAAANQSNAELLQVRAEPGGLSSDERGRNAAQCNRNDQQKTKNDNLLEAARCRELCTCNRKHRAKSRVSAKRRAKSKRKPMEETISLYIYI